MNPLIRGITVVVFLGLLTVCSAQLPKILTLKGGMIGESNIFLAGPCDNAAKAGGNPAFCATLCPEGDCSKDMASSPRSSFAVALQDLPGQQLVDLVITQTTYLFDVESPTIVGITTKNATIFTCKDANCGDYAQQSFGMTGSKIDATFGKKSQLVIATSSPNLCVAICRNPLCNEKPAPNCHPTFNGLDADVRIFSNVANGQYLAFTNDRSTNLIVVHEIQHVGSAQFKNSYPIHKTSGNYFDVVPITTKQGKKDTTTEWVVSYLNAQTISIKSCAVESLASCGNSESVTTISFNLPVWGYKTYVIDAKQKQFVVAASIGTSGNHSFAFTTCSVNPPSTTPTCDTPEIELYNNEDELPFAVAPVVALKSSKTGPGIFSQFDAPKDGSVAATKIYGWYPNFKDNSGTFTINLSEFKTSKYHKPPPNITIALIVLAAVGVVSSILVLVYRLKVGKPQKPGYSAI